MNSRVWLCLRRRFGSAEKLADYPRQLPHQLLLDLFLHLSIRGLQEIKTALSILDFTAYRASRISLLPTIDTVLAVGVEAGQDTLDFFLEADTADVDLIQIVRRGAVCLLRFLYKRCIFRFQLDLQIMLMTLGRQKDSSCLFLTWSGSHLVLLAEARNVVEHDIQRAYLFYKVTDRTELANKNEIGLAILFFFIGAFRWCLRRSIGGSPSVLHQNGSLGQLAVEKPLFHSVTQ